jgi:hypothetical protein
VLLEQETLKQIIRTGLLEMDSRMLLHDQTKKIVLTKMSYNTGSKTIFFSYTRDDQKLTGLCK